MFRRRLSSVCHWLPYGQDGVGMYSKNMDLAADTLIIEMCTERILQALDKINKTDDGPFVICDYGCTDGGMTLSLIKACVEAVKDKYGPDQEVIIVYEDLPSNNFKSLFGYVHGKISDAEAYYMDIPGVTVMASATSFYKQCLPRNYLHFGLSFTAFQWLKKRPCALKNSIVHLNSEDEKEQRIFEEQARHDWETLLLQRAKELKPRGRLMIGTLGRSQERLLSDNSSKDHIDMHTAFDHILHDMVMENKITRQELASITLDIYIRTQAECEAPFLDAHSAVRQSGLSLHSIETITVDDPCFIHGNFINRHGVASAQKYAQEHTDRVRQFTNCTIYLGLNAERPEYERESLLEEFYARYAQIVASCPAKHRAILVEIFLEVEKIPEEKQNHA